MNLANRASESANEYAQKKREQIENARKMREDRKQASLLKNVGEQFVLKPSSGNGTNAQ
jgi:F420-0:gamma-glutamyl ligase-like protein